MHHLQKILFIIAVLTLGFSIWYYLQLDNSPKQKVPAVMSPIKEDLPVRAIKEFDVRNFGLEGEEAARLNLYFKDVKREMSDILTRGEMVVIFMAEFKTEDAYRQKLYMALSLADHLKVITRRTCDKLTRKLADETSPEQQEKIKSTPEYITCFPGKW